MNETDYNAGHSVENQRCMMEEFAEAGRDVTITTEDLDNKVKEMKDAEATYKTAKTISNDLHAEFQTHQMQLIAMMQAANKKKYHVDGLGTASVVEKLKVKTPKTLEAKQALYDWIQTRDGKDGLVAQTTVNYATLQRIYNEAFEEAKLAGTLDTFKVDGVDTPEAEYSLSFRK